MREEYRFDYAKSKPNRFDAKLDRVRIAVVLDPDVAAVFKTPESVNSFLRCAISAVKPKRKK